MVLIHLECPGLNEARIAARVSEGGHSVPADKVISSIPRLLDQVRASIALVDVLRVYDNSSAVDPFVPMYTITNGSLRLHRDPRPVWAAALLRHSGHLIGLLHHSTRPRISRSMLIPIPNLHCRPRPTFHAPDHAQSTWPAGAIRAGWLQCAPPDRWAPSRSLPARAEVGSHQSAGSGTPCPQHAHHHALGQPALR